MSAPLLTTTADRRLDLQQIALLHGACSGTLLPQLLRARRDQTGRQIAEHVTP